ncbi:MAG TPA: glycine cleavage T C-terminal barrel domain-containing protein [Actinomycetota bacterium]|nr:glycine cleavage T C-terminal barrel domain-containing protein [Actinomycetota bacterium]
MAEAPRRTKEVPLLFVDGTRVRRSPYWEATEAAGCLSYDIYNHMLIPGWYSDFVHEYWHIVNHVALWDVAVERCLEISGPDAHRFTNMLTPRDLDRCAVTQGKYVVMTDENGGIINDPVLLRLEENRYWLALADSDATLWAKGVAVNSGMDVEVREADAWPLQVQGPKSRDVLRALVGEAVDGVRYYWTLQTDIDGIAVVISRTGWTGELGFEVYLRDDPSKGVALWERIMDAGKPFNIRPTGPSDIRRMEAGIFNYGGDMTIEHNPLEVTGLERMVEDKQADYVGKEALLSIKAEGVRRKLVGMELAGTPLDIDYQEFWPVTSDGVVVGKVTNAVHSPRLDKNIAYAWVPIELAGHGTKLDVETPVGPAAAQVVPLPFLDPNKEIPKS